jgi:protoporphyrinogen oxidase
MARVVVIGAGAMGLAAAHRAVSLGHVVDLIEADEVAGGMAAHFDFGGLSIERFYHFICKSDEPTFALMRELGIADRLRWQSTSMGYYMDGKIHPWGDPLALLRFPHLSLAQKLRSGWQMFHTTRAKDFADIEGLTAHQWLAGGSGEDVYRILWKRLMDLKFYEMAEDISASWIATRIRRVGTSRRSLFQEELGYIDGGSQTLVDSLVRAFTKMGGRLHLSTPARRVTVEVGRVTGVEVADRAFAADAVISTVPTPFVPMLVPDLPDSAKQAYAAIRNVGVICILFKLKKSVSKHFWVNVSDPEINIPGLIEFSNLRPMKDHVVYVPYYMPDTHPKWQWSDERILGEAFGYLRRVNPGLQESDVIEAKANRLRYAQPVCEPNFRDKLPRIQTSIMGLMSADTCYYYPEDRGIAESVRYGRMMAEMIST